MEIGLVALDSHNFPNLPIMKISAYHKAKGDSVEWAMPIKHYDRVYVSRVFGDEYTQDNSFCYNADEVFFGGTGYAISVENGREVYRKERDKDLPDEIEHQYPDYDLYPELTKDTAFGFLTRGCPNNCGYCIITQKEGRVSHKVADLSEFWRGQREIKLLDANLLSCKDRNDLLRQLADSRAEVDFTQGLDARFMTKEIAHMLGQIKIKAVHFAFDQMENAERIVKGLELFKRECPLDYRKSIVYMLTNYDTTLAEDFYRLRAIRDRGYMPDVRIYRKKTAPQILNDLQRWCNSRYIYRSCDFADYKPRQGKTISELYPKLKEWGWQNET